jgi:prepilin-type N-terminal cleavage/methylation domain-containing protein
VSASTLAARRQAGFTLVEIMIVVSVLALIAVVFLGMATSYFVVINRNNHLQEMTVGSQNLIRSTVESIRYGDGIRQTNQITDPNAPAGGWNTSNSSFVIIIPVPALASDRSYIIDPDTGSPYMNELVYYRNGSTLMKRTLANPDATGNNLHTSCPSSIASASCPADVTLAQYVKSMTFTLYDQNAVQTATPSLARSVKVTLAMQRNAPGSPLNLTTSIRVTLRNRF